MLSGDQIAFLETFIRCRGSLKDVGVVVGISYPTARNRLDSLIRAFGFDDKNALSEGRLGILTQLKEGTLTVEQALNILQGGKNAKGFEILNEIDVDEMLAGIDDGEAALPITIVDVDDASTGETVKITIQ